MALAVQLMTQNGTNVHQALANKNDKHVSMSEDSSKRRHLFTWGPRSGVQCSLLEWGVVEQLLDEVDMSQQHTAAAVPLQAQGVQGIPARHAPRIRVIRPGQGSNSRVQLSCRELLQLTACRQTNKCPLCRPGNGRNLEEHVIRLEEGKMCSILLSTP